ncbi:MAG: CHAT domain-containing protein [Deltaproteobacteria bacterium]
MHRFLDGEMAPDEAERFRAEVAESESLQRELDDLLQLEAYTSAIAEGQGKVARLFPTPASHGRARRTPWALVASVAIAASVASAGGVYVALQPSADERLEMVFATLGRDRVEVRMSHPAADRYVPYNPSLSGDAKKSSTLPLGTLAALEESGEFRAIGSAYLFVGSPELAKPYLDKVEPGADGWNDQAAVAFELGEMQEALALLERALALEPEHPQALWNRGLVLEALGLHLAAAESFERSSEVSSSEWSKAARERAARLRSSALDWRRRWYEARKAGKRMVAAAEPIARDLVTEFPGIARLYLYDAIRSATSKDEVLRLEPIAVQLDEMAGGTMLADAIRAAADDDFRRRAAVARRYRSLALGTLEPAEVRRLIDDCRAGGFDDHLIGAIYLGYREVELADEFQELCERTRDPWLMTLGDAVQAERHQRAGHVDQAFSRYVEARSNSSVDYRTSHIDVRLAQLAIDMQRPVAARRILDEGVARSTRRREWSQVVELLQLRGRLAVRQNQLALAEAYFREAILREPERCDVKRFLRTYRASSALDDHRPEDARRILAEEDGCKHGFTQMEALAATDVLSRAARPDPDVSLEAGIEELKSSARTKGDRDFAQVIEGRYHLAVGKTQDGLVKLGEVAREPPVTGSDAIARHARSLAYATLVAHYGGAGAYEEVLSLVAREVGAQAPARCALALAMDSGRSTVAIAKSDGGIEGRHDPTFRVRARDVVAGELVPKAYVDALAACERVDVFARPPLVGDPSTLPPRIEWQFVLAGPNRRPRPRKERAIAVADVDLPRELELAPLPTYTPPAVGAPFVEVIRGPEATPSRVLSAMKDATEIELFTHGTHDTRDSDVAMLVLSKDDDGRFALTAEMIQEAELTGAPAVLLTACSTTVAPRYRYSPWNLPYAFLEAGARVVVAAGVPLSAVEAKSFFEVVREGLRAGSSATRAVYNARKAAGPNAPDWVRSVVILGRAAPEYEEER